MATIAVRQIDRADKEWLQREAARQGLSMEELVRLLVREKASIISPTKLTGGRRWSAQRTRCGLL
jgi:hypothetical protein